jgi:hypothetical protein
VATDLEVRVRFLALPDFLWSVGLERDPVRVVSTIEGQSSGFGLQNQDYGCRDLPH